MEAREYISSGILEIYVLGMATAEETAEVLAMAEKYPEVKAELLSIERSMEDYALSQAIEPSASLKNNISARIDRAPGNSPVKIAPVISISPVWKYVAAAAVLLLIGSLYFNLRYYNKYQIASEDKQHAEEQLLAQQRINDEMHNDMSIVQSKFSTPVALDPMPNGPDAAAKIFWMKNTTGEVYIDPSNLPDAPNGMQYQVWGFIDGKPVDAGMIITTDKDNKFRIQKMKTKFLGVKIEAFAVSLETKGGNPQPKGQVYVYGKM